MRLGCLGFYPVPKPPQFIVVSLLMRSLCWTVSSMSAGPPPFIFVIPTTYYLVRPREALNKSPLNE